MPLLEGCQLDLFALPAEPIAEPEPPTARVLSLWQPWASLCALGLKRFETRSWPTAYRGPLLIHAAKRPSLEGEFRSACFNLPQEDQARVWQHASQHRGAIVAIGEVTDCLQMVESPPKVGQIHLEAVSAIERSVGDWRPGRYAWRLEAVRAIEPIAWKGGQGLRTAPHDLVMACKAAPLDLATARPLKRCARSGGLSPIPGADRRGAQG